jgi:hypothetical protein
LIAGTAASSVTPISGIMSGIKSDGSECADQRDLDMARRLAVESTETGATGKKQGNTKG